MKRLINTKATTWIVALVALAFVASCDSGVSIDTGSNPSFKKTEAYLTAFNQCSDLKGYLSQVYLNEQKKRWENDHYYGDVVMSDANVGGINSPQPSGGLETGTNAPTSSNDNQTKDPTSFTETNNQEKGVDEADIVKTDGKYFYVLSGRTLYILSSWPAAETKQLSKIDLKESPREMFVYENKVLVFSNSYYYNYDGKDVPGQTGPTAPPTVPGETSTGGDVKEQPKPVAPEITGERLRVTLIDIADKTSPKIVRDVYAQGGYVSSRMVNGSVHIVVRSNLKLPTVHYYKPYNYDDIPTPTSGGTTGSTGTGTTTVEPSPAPAPTPDTDGDPDGKITRPLEADIMPYPYEEPEQQYKTVEEAVAALKKLLDGEELAEWLPKYSVVVDGKTADTGQLTGCQKFYKPSVQMGLGVLSVLTLNLNNDDGKFDTTAILGNTETVYSSADKLVLAGYVWGYWYWDEDKNDDTDLSYVHQFQLDKDGVYYEASGKLKGYILNQFSMSEHKGYLRIATSTRRFRGDDEATNSLYVLGRVGQNLNIVGSVLGLAPGERIYSARFFADRGYVVTFRETDPLFTFDLTDPRNPKQLGELKVPGFSTYIHPLGENHLLTIGRDTEEIEPGIIRTVGTKLSIFDVTDPKNPKEAHTLTFGKGSSSNAEYDHKAFTFYAEKGILAIPLNINNWEGNTKPESGLKVLKVSATDGFKEMGFVNHDNFMSTDQPYYRSVRILRSMMIEDYVYSVSNHGVKVSSLLDLSDVATVPFPVDNTYNGCGEFEPCIGGPEPMPDVMP